MKRVEYEHLFSEYPDVVTLPVFREMLGGIGDSTARKLMRENHVKHFIARGTAGIGIQTKELKRCISCSIRLKRMINCILAPIGRTEHEKNCNELNAR